RHEAMKPFRSMLVAVATLLAAQFATAQSVYVNFRNTPPGDYTVRSGSVVIVRNTSEGEVTVQVPYEPPVVLKPGESTVVFVNPNPGGSTTVDGHSGSWRFTAATE